MLTEKHLDRDHWAKVHVEGDRSKAVNLPDRRRGQGYVFFMWRRKKETAE